MRLAKLLLSVMVSAVGTLAARAQSGAPMPVVITPGNLQAHGDEAVGRRGRNGTYMFDATMNGVPLEMMFDTGASLITLRADDAARVGIDMSSLSYSRLAKTANGTAQVALTMVDTLTVGDITRRHIPALVAKPGSLEVNLLGQSFLQRVAGYRMEGNQLILQGGE
jgi:aspartyl protease family protein